MTLRLAFSLPFVALVAASCGGATVPDADPPASSADASTSDSGADAAASAGTCHSANGTCAGDPGCCPPYQARVIDLVEGCTDSTQTELGCFSPRQCMRPSTGDPSCYLLHRPSVPDRVVVSTSNLLEATDNFFTRCDDTTTKAALAGFYACP